jgi:hypothetical protein
MFVISGQQHASWPSWFLQRAWLHTLKPVSQALEDPDNRLV